MVEIIPVETPSLGDRSYVAHDGEVAAVVDPQRDVDRVLELCEREGVRVTHVVETHIHNDYVTGGLALAQRTGATYHVNADDPVAYERHPVRDGDVIEVSPSMTLTVLATPGHTFTHLSYALSSGGRDVAVFTGGSLLYGSTGRPDLLGPDHTDALAHHQYASARRLAEQVADDAAVLPTHGFGSFCSSSQSDATSSTIGEERRSNPVLTEAEESWVRDLLDGLDVFPAYYAHMGPANLAGPDAPDLRAPAPADKAEIRRRIEAGEWVVDLRTRSAFAAGHVPGTFNLGVDGQFATYVGWLVPWGADLTVLGESPEQVAQAQRELVRIGVDELAGSATGSPQDWTDAPLATLRRATFADLAEVLHHRRVAVLDVRREREFAAGHIEGAVNIPIHEIVERLDEVPQGEVWVHCAGGYRASVVASIVAATGRTVVAVDDGFERTAEVGLV
ncbi:MBL fold metallo-hydrolase [Phycicoccus flavus]|uniref:MBL fold metallo-hydrolase n=1 Tax=Phycicoccus flavus TaxID=2502783 RepID=UPI000FEC00C3|nr:MBL fold metallo-hydrolase [Phycicoccus flavus]NHA69438.1 MBL fold metallo-hydrolase [Phycicoccus flavus]